MSQTQRLHPHLEGTAESGRRIVSIRNHIELPNQTQTDGARAICHNHIHVDA